MYFYFLTLWALIVLVLKALRALKDRKSVWEGLDGAQRRIVESSIRQMEASGVGEICSLYS